MTFKTCASLRSESNKFMFRGPRISISFHPPNSPHAKHGVANNCIFWLGTFGVPRTARTCFGSMRAVLGTFGWARGVLRTARMGARSPEDSSHVRRFFGFPANIGIDADTCGSERGVCMITCTCVVGTHGRDSANGVEQFIYSDILLIRCSCLRPVYLCNQ